MGNVTTVQAGKRATYPAYKPSGMDWVDDVPEHWEVHRLKHIASVQFSSVDKHTKEDETPVRLCNYVDVYYNDFIKDGIDFMAATATRSEIDRFHLRHGDVLITKDSEAWDDIAVPAYVAEEFDGVLCGYHLARIRPDLRKVLGEYLFRAFRSRGVNDQFRVAANGITRFGLGKYWLDNGLFPVPPLDEQKAIAAFLDRETARIDALIEKKRRQIELLQEKRSALISHAVTKGLNPNAPMKTSGIEWLESVPAHWELKRVKHLARILRGKFTHRPRNDPRMYDGPYPFIQTGDVSSASKYVREYHQTLSEDGFAVSKMFPKGTLVMTIAANVGDMAILDFEACFPDSIVGFVPQRDISLDFLYYMFIGLRPALMSTATLNTQLNLNIDRIASIAGVLPPLKEQLSIVDRLESHSERVNSLVRRIGASISVLREHRVALISAAVTGKTDVRQEVDCG